MIGLSKIAAYIPPGRLDNRARRAAFEITDEFLCTKIGVERVARRGEGEDTADLCEKAYTQLRSEIALEPAAIDCLVVITQNPQGSGLPHTSAILHGRLGLAPHCACWDISLGCSGFVHGLVIVQSFMAAHSLRHGLLFTADPYSKIVDPDDRNTALIFGDGATVSLLAPATAERPLFAPIAARFHTEGGRHRALENRGGILHMDGRAVFNFSATVVPRQIDDLLRGLGRTRGDVDVYLLHQGSRYIVDTLRQRLGVEEGKVPLQLADHGNLVSSSIPVMLRGYLERADTKRIVLSGFGVGLASASCVLERQPRALDL
jgi:3-oxoacyl-[acyl-carrier-protein] synthase-3